MTLDYRFTADEPYTHFSFKWKHINGKQLVTILIFKMGLDSVPLNL